MARMHIATFHPDRDPIVISLGDRGIMLGTTARSWDEGARLSLAMPNVPEDKYRRHFLSSPKCQRHATRVNQAIFHHPCRRTTLIFCNPEPPEARVRSPRAKDTQVKGPFTLIRGCGLTVMFSQTPNRRRRARAP
ncbi:hypothetical protein EV715DRAFT_266800 [Schizophyllum commune]